MPDNPRMRAHAQSLRTATQMFLATIGEGLSEENTLHQLSPSKSHILWQIGHAALTCDLFVGPHVGRESSLPHSHSAMFGFGSQPEADAEKYPSLEELTATLKTTAEDLAATIEKAPDSLADQELPDEFPLKAMFQNVDRLIGMSYFHLGYHAGQIMLLRRAQGLPSPIGM